MSALTADTRWRLLCCAAAETALAQLVKAAGNQALLLKPLYGKVFCIRLTQLPWPLYLLFGSELQLLGEYHGRPDVSLSADAAALYQLRQGASLTELIKQDKLSIEGDLQLLQQFSLFLQQVRPQLAEPLSRYLGDAPAYWLTSGSARVGQELLQVARKTWSHLGQLATEEYRIAPHRLEFIHQCDNIDELTSAVEQLQQRIARLKDTISP